jgi:opacity protein-like surface antigen
MKKNIYNIILIFTFCLLAKAQVTKKNFEIGFNFGYNYFGVSSTKELNSEIGSGYNIGAFSTYYISDRWSVKGKLIYDQKGWDNGFITFITLSNSQPGGNIITTYKTNYRLNYLTIPVTINWHFGKTRKWYLNFGPYLGVLLNANETVLNTDVKSLYNAIDFGLAAGLGYKIPVTDNMKIFFEYDEQAGFTDILKQNSSSAINNRRGSINFGAVFLFK